MKACEAYIKALEDTRREANYLTNLDGFGEFGTSKEAKAFYAEQAKKWIQQVNDCIAIAESMRDAFIAAGKLTVNQEGNNESAVAKSGPR